MSWMGRHQVGESHLDQVQHGHLLYTAITEVENCSRNVSVDVNAESQP